MQETNGASQLALRGVDQQDFNELERVAGTYPYQSGLQQRIPGKSIVQIYDGEIGSIFVFYMVFGRTYTLIDFGSLVITETEVPPITLPALPPVSFRWYDTFGTYLVDTISRLWGGGLWLVGVGVCESIIEGTIDYFLAFGSGPYPTSPPVDQQPIPAPDVDTPPVSPIIPPTGPQVPGDCDDLLPDQNYQVLTIATYITSMQRKGGDYDSGETFPQTLPQPPYHAHPYNDLPGGDLTADESSIRQSYYNGFVNVSRSRSSGYYTVVHYNFNDYDWPIDARFFLVGTKALSNGTGGLFPNLDTTCASIELSSVGEMEGDITISTERGIFTSDVPTGADHGITAYTQLRVYSDTF